MKKYGIVIAVVCALAFVIAANAYAETVDQTASVTATATISGATSLSLSPASIIFGTTNADAFPTTPADKKVVLTYASNYNPWKVRIYTNNTQVPLFASPDGRYSKGGLATADGKNVVPCKWISQNPLTAAPAIGVIGGYNFIKDKRDEDDPSPSAPGDQSWAANATTYANIAYGGPGGGTCVNPTNPPNFTGNSVGGSIDVYIAGLFGTGGVSPAVPAAAGSYSSAIGFDLYHE